MWARLFFRDETSRDNAETVSPKAVGRRFIRRREDEPGRRRGGGQAPALPFISFAGRDFRVR